MKSENVILIISPIRNEEKRIDALIDSVTKQTFKNWKLLVYDNCSDDKSRVIVTNRASVDPRIILQEDNYLVDAASNFNRAIEFARENVEATYIAILGGDDELKEDNFLSKCLLELEKGVSLVVPQYEMFQVVDDLEVLGQTVFPEKFKFSHIKIYNRIRHGIRIEYGNMFYAIYRAEDFYRVFDDPRSKLSGIAKSRIGMNFSSDWWFTNTTLRLICGEIKFLKDITYRKFMKNIAYSDSYYFPRNSRPRSNGEGRKVFSRPSLVLLNTLFIPTIMLFSNPIRFKLRDTPEFVLLWCAMVLSRLSKGISRNLKSK